MNFNKSTGYISAPPEVWEIARKHIYTSDMDEIAYKAAGKKTIVPGPDFIELSGALVKELHEIGKKVRPISSVDASLPVFELDLFLENAIELYEVIQPKNPYRDDMSIFGFKAMFVASKDCIVCKITLCDCNDSGAGCNDVGVILLYDYGPNGFYSVPYVMNYDATYFYDYESITYLSHWLGYLWRGIQYRMINRPELVRVKHERIKKETIEDAKKRTKSSKQVVKVQRIITLLTDNSISATSGKHDITATVWGVSGHWRAYKSGKRVWVKPYYKGEDRDKLDAYCPKEYRFLEEVCND